MFFFYTFPVVSQMRERERERKSERERGRERQRERIEGERESVVLLAQSSKKDYIRFDVSPSVS